MIHPWHRPGCQCARRKARCKASRWVWRVQQVGAIGASGVVAGGQKAVQCGLVCGPACCHQRQAAQRRAQ